MEQLPEGFRESFSADFGEATYEALERELREESSPVSIRLNSAKLPKASATGQIPWCPEGRLLEERPIFGADPLWHAGAYYVQEPASMVVAKYLETLKVEPSLVIDLCAAPGGKSTLLRSRLPQDSLLISNEPERKRAKVLEENILRWGADNTIVTSAYPEALSETGIMADLILVDAPCSGEGMFRKEEAAITGWSLDHVDECARLQRGILRSAWEMLLEGGTLIYSTCTYNRRENEAQLSLLRDDCGAEVIPLPELVGYGVEESEEEAGVYRFFPHKTHSEGLTCFAVRKGGERPIRCEGASRKRKRPRIPEEVKKLEREGLLWSEEESAWYSLSPQWWLTLDLLEAARGVKILSTGVRLGMMKGKDFVPDQAWALSPQLSPLIPYRRREVTGEEAFDLIRRQTISSTREPGYYLATYRGVPLTLIKDLGSRVNNLYPKSLAMHDTRLTYGDMPHILDL